MALQGQGWRPLVVHGGGAAISEWLKLARYADSLRARPARHRRRLAAGGGGGAGRADQQGAGGGHQRPGRPAIGLSGADGALIRVSPLDPELGYVGQIERVDGDMLRRLLDGGLPAGGGAPGPPVGGRGPAEPDPEHQRRHRGRRGGPGPGRPLAGLPDRRPRHRRPRWPLPGSPVCRGGGGAGGGRRRLRRHDPQGRGLPAGRDGRRRARPSSTAASLTPCWRRWSGASWRARSSVRSEEAQ